MLKYIFNWEEFFVEVFNLLVDKKFNVIGIKDVFELMGKVLLVVWSLC